MQIFGLNIATTKKFSLFFLRLLLLLHFAYAEHVLPFDHNREGGKESEMGREREH